MYPGPFLPVRILAAGIDQLQQVAETERDAAAAVEHRTMRSSNTPNASMYHTRLPPCGEDFLSAGFSPFDCGF